MTTRPLPFALGLTLLGVALAYRIMGMPPLLGAEDAAIGFRYARNLAEGHGIVFNPGGERVEGFTSMLWLFVSAAVHRAFGEASLELVLFVLSFLLTVLVVALVLRLVFELVDDTAARWVAVLWLAGQAGFYFWSGLSLMDVAIWAVGVALFLDLLSRRAQGRPVPRGALPALVVMLVLTRPESMFVVPGMLVVAALAYGFHQPVRRLAAEVGASALLAIGALTAFRVAYFGHPLPNTYYAKVPPDLTFRLGQGIAYVSSYLTAHVLPWLAAVAVLAYAFHALVLWRRPDAPAATRLGALSSGLVLVGFASVVYGGGDHYEGHRFLQAYLPVAALPLALGVAALLGRLRPIRRPARLALSAVAIVLTAAPLYHEWTTFGGHGLRRQAFDVGLQGRFVGSTLAEVFAGEPMPEVGLWMVGGAGYAYPGPVKDLLGLNWKAMGMSPGDRQGIRDHAAFDLDVFWSAPPEIMVPELRVVLGPIRCIGVVFGGVLHHVLLTERFREEFEPVLVQRGDTEPIIAFARADWLRSAPPWIEPLGWSYCDGHPAG